MFGNGIFVHEERHVDLDLFTSSDSDISGEGGEPAVRVHESIIDILAFGDLVDEGGSFCFGFVLGGGGEFFFHFEFFSDLFVFGVSLLGESFIRDCLGVFVTVIELGASASES